MTDLQNIGPKQARLRVLSGSGALAAGLALSLVLVGRGEPRPWRLVVFAPYFFAGLGFFQARAGVCVAHARQGTCDMDGGAARVDDAARVAALRVVARSIYLKAALFAAALTAAAWFWPS